MERRFRPDSNQLHYPEEHVELHVTDAQKIEQLFGDPGITTPIPLFEASRQTITPAVSSLTVGLRPYEFDAAFGMNAHIPRSIRMDAVVSDTSRVSARHLKSALATEMGRLTDRQIDMAPYGTYMGVSMYHVGIDKKASADLLIKGSSVSLRAYALTGQTETDASRNNQTLSYFYLTATILANTLLQNKTPATPARSTITIEVPDTPATRPRPELEAHQTMDAIGGLTTAKDRLRELKDMLEDPETAYELDIDIGPALLLLHGDPGVGKTTLIKRFATEIGAELQEVSSMDIIDKWVGSAARNLRPFFQNAINQSREKPTVVFFKEIDSMITKDDRESSTEHTQLLAAFKTLIDDINELGPEHQLFIMADTNAKLSDLEPAIIRPGRFETIACKLPSLAEREDIWGRIIALEEMKRATKRRDTPERAQDVFTVENIEAGTNPDSVFGADVAAERLAALTEGMSGADFQAIIKTVRQQKYHHARGFKALNPNTAIGDSFRQISMGELEEAIARLKKR